MSTGPSSSNRPTRLWGADTSGRRFAAGIAVSLLLIAALTAIADTFHFNAASAGFLLLVGVLLVASREPLGVATIAAIAGTVSYNFFFFSPTRTLTIEDPANWFTLIIFLATSLLANRLLVKERQQAENAGARREELEALYEMSVTLLKGNGGMEQVGEAAVRYLDRIGAASGGVILLGASPQQQQVLAWFGAERTDEVEDIVAGVGRHGRVTEIPSRFGGDVCAPLTVGGRVKAALFVRGVAGSGAALQSAANLLSFAIERERFVHERAHVEALRETNELKTSLLQAVSHDLKSPLTVLTVESEALQRMRGVPAAASGHVGAIRDEVARLHRRIDNLLSVARFEAGIVAPRAEPTPAPDLFRAAREALPTITRARPVQTRVADDTSDILADPSLALEIVINLVENAHRASPPETPIELIARQSEEVRERVWIEVSDRGSGIPPEQVKTPRALDAPDATSRGLGVELARTLAALSGGSVEWFPRAGGGTIARLDLPAAVASKEGA